MCTRYSTRSSTRSSTTRGTADTAAAHEALAQPQQEGGAADRGDRAVPRVLRDARQERADQRAQLPVEASNLWAFFQAKTIRRTTTAHRRRHDEDRPARGAAEEAPEGRDDQADRRLATRPRRATLGAGSRSGGKGEARSSWRAPRSRRSTCATPRSPSTTTTRWRRPRSRSASCSPRPPSSPAWWC